MANEEVLEPEVITNTALALSPVKGMDLMPVDDVLNWVAYVKEIREKVLVPGEDFGIIPGTDKPTLLKPGAEKLRLAFNFSITMEIISEIEHPHEKWEYVTTEFDEVGGKKVPREVTKTAIGYYSYKTKATAMAGQRILAECIGEASSRQRGKETASPNSLLKVSQKRAYVGVVALATGTSGQFAIDLEDMTPEERESLDTSIASDKQINFIINMLKYRAVPDALAEEVQDWLDGKKHGGKAAKSYIDKMINLPEKARGGDSRQPQKPKSAPQPEQPEVKYASEAQIERLREYATDARLSEKLRHECSGALQANPSMGYAGAILGECKKYLDANKPTDAPATDSENLITPLIAKAKRLEEFFYPNLADTKQVELRDSARRMYLKTIILDECDGITLQEYIDRMEKKKSEKVKA